MSMVIMDGSVLEKSPEGTHPLSATEIWKRISAGENNLALQVIGYGNLKIKIVLEHSELFVGLEVLCEVGKLALEYIPSSQVDYAIIDHWLVPLERFEVEALVTILQDLNISIDSRISLGQCYSLLAKANLSNIPIELSDEIITNYRPQLESAGKIELALPLYQYQVTGVKWLTGLFEEEIGGLLCDEMGLGKTAQVFGLIAYALTKGNQDILIITPSSLTINWEREILKFVPGLDLYSHVGPSRIFEPTKFASQNIVLTSYDLLRRDKHLFNSRSWDLVICDEAQALKNRDSQSHKVVSELKSMRKFLVTGTPIENSLKDVWSLSNIVRPGVLGSFRTFEALIEDHFHDAQRLSRHLAPLILRRIVLDVMSDLPGLVEIEEPLMPTPLFCDFYESARTGQLDQVSGASILALLSKLRQICCYPRLVDPLYNDKHDSKFTRLLEILGGIQTSSEDKVIVFSSFTKSLDLIQSVIQRQLANPYVEIIDGRVTNENRYAILDEFARIEGFAVLCINPRAGGSGLNITSANHVVHFDPQWNPAVEKQATARAYRRGQDKPVFVHKLFYMGTVEEVIRERLIFKDVLSDISLSEAVAEGSDKEIQKALAMSPIYI
jgi:SNF2 family DNA or RNA helicase